MTRMGHSPCCADRFGLCVEILTLAESVFGGSSQRKQSKSKAKRRGRTSAGHVFDDSFGRSPVSKRGTRHEQKNHLFGEPPMVVTGGLGTRTYNTDQLRPPDFASPPSLVTWYSTCVEVRAAVASATPNSTISVKAVVVSHHESHNLLHKILI